MMNEIKILKMDKCNRNLMTVNQDTIDSQVIDVGSIESKEAY